MTDQCKHCTLRGDPDVCSITLCNLHESWRVQWLAAEAEMLEPMRRVLADWLKFAEDVQPSCPVGEDWLSGLRAKTLALHKGNRP